MASMALAEQDRGPSGGRKSSRIGQPRPVKLALSLLAVLFGIRILLQMVQVVAGLPLLPSSAFWDSAVLSYGALLSVQLLLLGAMVLLIRAVDGRPRPELGLLFCLFGGAYLMAMLVRAAIGAYGLLEGDWFQAPLPTSFHLVLAGFLVILGQHWRRAGKRARERAGGGRLAAAARYLLYPATLCGALVLFAWSLGSDIPAPFAAYHAVLLGAAAVVIAEVLLPYRQSWQPRGRDLLHDVVYLGAVQVVLPAALSAGLVALAERLPSAGLNLWPQAWPLAAQVALMLLLSDFARYWLHRASHAWLPLWRLHAVHHAPVGLHALNVGRFHPLEKALQFGLDSLPFLLLGAAPEVMAAYLVFYAVNGFFQHSNVDVQLGWLNWIVSGPELHRWHHARNPRISDHNFGNNLILWDLLFGTRFLPNDRAVGALGLRNRAYPQDPIRQVLAPFCTDPNRGDAK